MIDLAFNNSTSNKKYSSKFFEKILLAGLKELDFGNKNIEISISLVGEAKIRSLNKKYRQKDKATDVLSFPMGEKAETQDLGDIFICLSIAKKQAKSENKDIKEKLAQLTVHGFLHLLGYDHEKSEKGAEKMFSLENKILTKLIF
jgi:probable rRNA maturation factor